MRKLLLFLAAGVAASLALIASPGASAQHISSITFQSPHCNGYILAKTGPTSFTLSCVFTSCTMVASSGTAVPNTRVTLTASCTPAPTSVLWTASPGCTAPTPSAPNSLTATVTETSERICGYYASVSDGTLQGQGSTPVTWSNAPPPPPPPPPSAPSGCTVARTTPASGSLSTTGGAITLTGSCSGGSAPTAWEWRRNGAATSVTTASYSETLPANTGTAATTYSYDARACNGTACSAWTSPATTVTVGGSAPAGFCSSYGDVRYIDLNWGSPPVDTAGTVGLVPGTVIVARLNVPAGATSPGDNPGIVSMVEFMGPTAYRVMTLSTQPCDFRGFSPGYVPPPDPSGTNGPLFWARDPNPNIPFLFMGDNPGMFPVKPLLNPGQTYFINLQTIHYATGGSTCSGACDVRFTVDPPR